MSFCPKEFSTKHAKLQNLEETRWLLCAEVDVLNFTYEAKRLNYAESCFASLQFHSAGSGRSPLSMVYHRAISSYNRDAKKKKERTQSQETMSRQAKSIHLKSISSKFNLNNIIKPRALNKTLRYNDIHIYIKSMEKVVTAGREDRCGIFLPTIFLFLRLIGKQSNRTRSFLAGTLIFS